MSMGRSRAASRDFSKPISMRSARSLRRGSGNLRRDNKFVGDDDLIEIPGLEQLTQLGIDEGDRDFVRAAASVAGSILVTTDSPLTARIKEQGIDQQYGFSVISQRDALSLAET